MNRTDRLMAIVWLLRTRTRLTAAQLGETFGVTVRTIYRDVEALCEAGVPVVALPGTDGGYELAPGYKVTPIAFRTDEVEALWVAGMAFAELRLPALNDSLRSALGKIMAMAAPDKVDQTRRLSEHFAVRLERRGSEALQGEVFDLLRQAVLDRRTVSIAYTAISGETSERLVAPERLLFQFGAWYIQGPDSRSGEYRTFRVDRISACRLTDDSPPPAPAPETGAPAETVTPVRIHMSAANARWYREHPVFRWWEQTQCDGGTVQLQVPESGIPSLLAALLAFGGQEVVLEPPWLIDQLLDCAKKAIAAHTLPDRTVSG
ncbi:MAG TPA: YafY family protein [Symbiobacteriaceae bacterium]|nr:YafY family protein [Symbiobacteriaceae bacterium]